MSGDHIPALTVGRRIIGGGRPTYLIAEVGSNHNGSLKTAKELVRLSAEAGADAVKFQAFDRTRLFAPSLPEDGGEQARQNRVLLRRRWDILPQFTAADAWWPELKQLCDELGVDFLCTAFDLERLEAIDTLGVKAHKIASGDLTWAELLEAAARTGKPVLLSTGASSLDEVRRAVRQITQAGCRRLALLHCVSNYPPRWADVNLRAIQTLEREFDVPVGLSDHTPGATLPVAAVALGACLIEKHVTLNRAQEGLDHHFALEIDEFAEMAQQVRRIESALGDSEKTWSPDEETERYWVRRGIYLRCDLPAGAELRREHVDIVRPREGISAGELHNALGKRLSGEVRQGMPLYAKDLTKKYSNEETQVRDDKDDSNRSSANGVDKAARQNAQDSRRPPLD